MICVMRPRVDEDEQAREHEASDALEDDEEVAPRLVLREEEFEVRDRLVSARASIFRCCISLF